MGAKPLLLGESPAKGGDPKRPLSGKCAKTLCQLMGLYARGVGADCLYEMVTERFDCLNSVESGGWSHVRARERMHVWFVQNGTPETIVCLGRRAAASTNLIPPRQPWGDWYEWYYDGLLCSIVVIPHPSGLNRLYNDPAMRTLATRVLTEACES